MDVMSIAAAGMQRDLQRLDTISQNVANAVTPGYKKQISVTGSFMLQVEQGLQAAAGAGAPAPETRLSIDPSAGTLRFTGNPQDVAIEGDGYFEVAAPDGLRYTRHGTLRTDNGGRLVGANGMPVMGMGGEIVLPGGAFTIDASGQVKQDGRVMGQLKIVKFDEASRLQPVGGNLYAQGAAVPAARGDAGTVRSGYQENSNVNSSHEMVRLAETVRHFEALTRIAQGYDDVLEKTIRKLGEF